MGVSRPGSLAGLHADRPTASDLPPGTLWLSTDQDDGTLFRTDGSSWTQVAAGVSATGGSVSVEDDGTQVVAEASTLDFGTGLSVTDNGSGDVTIDLSATGDGAYAETIGDGSATSFAVTHNLGTEDVHVQVWDVSGTDPVLANGDPSSVTATDTNTVTVAFGSAPSTDQYRVVVLASGSSGGGSSLSFDDTTLTSTTSPGSSFGQWGTEHTAFADPGTAVTVTAWLSGNFDVANANVTVVPEWKLQISTDGGSTWTDGSLSSGGGQRKTDASVRIQRGPTPAQLTWTGTPTGEVRVRAQIRDALGETTNLTFANGHIMAQMS